MDLEAIPGLWDKVNTEIHSMNEEFCSHQNELGDVDDTPGGANASVDLYRQKYIIPLHQSMQLGFQPGKSCSYNSPTGSYPYLA